MADFDPLHPVFHDPQIESFTVEDHLDDRTNAAMLELAKRATIGEPIREVIDRLDGDTE